MSLSYDIIRDLYLKNRNFCSSDYDECVEYISKIIEGKVLNFTNEHESNGWSIPPKWDLQKGSISKNGEVILDATQHPLQVICLSASFSGKLTHDELREHLNYETHFDIGGDAIPFHFRQNYQPWKRDWGFNVSREFYDGISDGEYEVVIETTESEGYLTVFESTVEGENPECFYFVAHLDHPGMANDDLAGCAVGIELFQNLQRKGKPKFTYKLLIVQEITGSSYYLGNLNEAERKNIKGALFLEMLGSKTPLTLQSSYYKNSIVEGCLEQVLFDNDLQVNKGDFGTIIGNDEIVFEAFQIPMPSISRFPFPEYHTNKDSIDIIEQSSLAESVKILQSLVDMLDKQVLVEKHFEGIVALSNPEYDLYIDLGARGELSTPEGIKFRKLMDKIAYIREPTTISSLARMFELTEEDVESYLRKWEDKELLKLV